MARKPQTTETTGAEVVLHLSLSGLTPEPTLTSINISTLVEKALAHEDFTTIGGVNSFSAKRFIIAADLAREVLVTIADALKVNTGDEGILDNTKLSDDVLKAAKENLTANSIIMIRTKLTK